MNELRHLANFPWATCGRDETANELFSKIKEERDRVRLFPTTPLVSLIIAAEQSTHPAKLERCLEALSLQSYPHFEAILVGCADIPIRFSTDSRFRWISSRFSSRAELLKAGIESAKGEWLGFLHPHDVLSPIALFHYMHSVVGEERPDVLYCHEAFLSSDGKKVREFLSKPSFSWFTLLHFNYVGRGALFRRQVLEASQGLRVSDGDFAEWAFLLRLSERSHDWKNLPMYLNYREDRPDWTLPQSEAGKTEWISHLERCGVGAEIQNRGHLTTLLPHYPTNDPVVSIVICFKNRADWTIRCLENLSAQNQVKLELILVNNNSTSDEVERVRRVTRAFPHPVRWMDYEHPFNFAHMHNQAVRSFVSGEYLMLLNNDVFLEDPSTVHRMVRWAQLDWVGTIGLCLRFGHGGVQHGGFGVRYGGLARLARIGNAQQNDELAVINHEVYGNTFAACLMKTSTYKSVGGLKELVAANGFGDVIFNFECLRRGLKNLYLGEIAATHLESASRGTSYEYWEECYVEAEYPAILQKMLRQDLAINRVPGRDYSLPAFLKEYVAIQLRKRAPWARQAIQIVRNFNRKEKPAILSPGGSPDRSATSPN
jgi:O-antigen biosynthesis protein